MTASDKPIQEDVNRALNIFRDSFRDFTVRRLRTVRGRKPEDAIIASLRGHAYNNAIDVQKRGGDPRDMFDVGEFFFIVRDNWRDAFADGFRGDRSILNALSQIGSVRNHASHARYGRDIRRESAMSRIADMMDILGQINDAGAQAAVRAVWESLDEMSAAPAPDAPPPQSAPPDAPQPEQPAAPRGGKRPLAAWREVMRPRDDVIGGDASQSDFAASLSDVHSGRAGRDYADPFDFFRHTYVTDGIRTLLVSALRRLAGNGGEPVIQAKTVFGGGKTHSLIALYHLVNSGDALINPRPTADAEDRRVSEEIRALMREAGIDPQNGVPARAAVIDCNEITATSDAKTAAGDPLNTIWGEIAYQLGGQDAYDVIGDAARAWTSPGTAELRALFAHVGPCVILIDELVAYTRNIPNEDMRGKFFSFVQYLTEAARQSESAALVITLPETADEAGTDAGRKAMEQISALAVLENLTARVEAVWHPLEVSETFEVIRRRLFGDSIDEAERDRTCAAFAAMYRQQRKGDYPPEASEARYRQRLEQCYPVHPEFFDRVFFDWSADPRFQRTRGALRVMAAAISRLYARQDASPLIMPADAPLDDDAVSQQFVRLLGDNWGPALNEIDSDNGKLDAIDRQSSSFRDVGGASRRLARAIFLGSKPGRATRGLDRQSVNLAAVRPSEGAATYRDALNRMVGELYYLYEERGRFYFHNEENLNRLAADRVREMTESQVHEKIAEIIGQAIAPRRRALVVACPGEPAAVPDTDRARLVVLPPDKSIPNRKSEEGGARDAEAFALRILQDARPDVPRIRKNSLIFLTARRDEIRDIERRTREFLAWESIAQPAVQTLNLSRERRRLAAQNMAAAKSGMDAALKSAYVHLLAPEQPDGASADFNFTPYRVADADGEIIENALALIEDEELLINSILPAALLNGINRTVWREGEDHIGVSALWDSLANYVHSPFRLADMDVLTACLAKGVQQGVFGVADETEDRDGNHYPNLRIGEPIDRIPETALIVRREMANMVVEERRKDQSEPPDPTPPNPDVIREDPTVIILTPPQPSLPTRIEVRKTASGDIDMNAVSDMQNEIVRNLTEGGGEVTVSITITARHPDGFPEQTTRPTRENSEQLGLEYEQR